MINYWNFNKSGNITSFYLDAHDFGKWSEQNKAVFSGAYVEGVLLDSFVMETKRGYAFFYEHYLNSCSSDYAVFFIPYEAGKQHKKEYDSLWSEWFEFEEKASAFC
jgi:hypothetical protein